MDEEWEQSWSSKALRMRMLRATAARLKLHAWKWVTDKPLASAAVVGFNVNTLRYKLDDGTVEAREQAVRQQLSQHMAHNLDRAEERAEAIEALRAQNLALTGEPDLDSERIPDDPPPWWWRRRRADLEGPSAALTLQRVYRGWRVRRPYLALRRATVQIQSEWRLWRRNAAATVLQRYVRGYLVRTRKCWMPFPGRYREEVADAREPMPPLAQWPPRPPPVMAGEEPGEGTADESRAAESKSAGGDEDLEEKAEDAALPATPAVGDGGCATVVWYHAYLMHDAQRCEHLRRGRGLWLTAHHVVADGDVSSAIEQGPLLRAGRRER